MESQDNTGSDRGFGRGSEAKEGWCWVYKYNVRFHGDELLVSLESSTFMRADEIPHQDVRPVAKTVEDLVLELERVAAFIRIMHTSEWFLFSFVGIDLETSNLPGFIFQKGGKDVRFNRN